MFALLGFPQVQGVGFPIECSAGVVVPIVVLTGVGFPPLGLVMTSELFHDGEINRKASKER